MAATPMTEELDLDTGIVGRLVGAQFPQWSHLIVREVSQTGTDHAIFRLGEHLAVRLSRGAGASRTGTGATAGTVGGCS